MIFFMIYFLYLAKLIFAFKAKIKYSMGKNQIVGMYQDLMLMISNIRSFIDNIYCYEQQAVYLSQPFVGLH